MIPIKTPLLAAGCSLYYTSAFIKANRLEEAEQTLKIAEELLSEKTSLLTHEDFIMMKINLLCYQQKYEECYHLLQKNIRFFYHRKWGFKGLIYFLKRRLNILTIEDYEHGSSYLVNQIISYNEKEALMHIQKHQSPQENPDSSYTQFVPSVSLEKIYYEIRSKLPLEKRYNPGTFQNSYVFGYLANGHVNNKLVDYIEVITLANSKDIITMYPYENREKREYHDITPTLNSSSLKRQRGSQIDKFNARYGKK